MRRFLSKSLIVLATLGIAESARGQIIKDLTPPLIADAIRAGEGAGIPSIELVRGGAWAGKIEMGTFSTPFLRVALAARQAKTMYRTFKASDVTPEMVAPELHVYAWGQVNGPSTINVATVVITPHNGSPAAKQAKALHPVRFEPIPMTFQNLLGFKGEGSGMMAVFPLSALSEDNDLHVVYEREINANHLARHMVGVMSCIDCDIQFKLKGVR